jgi:hypothetical protein
LSSHPRNKVDKEEETFTNGLKPTIQVAALRSTSYLQLKNEKEGDGSE